MRLFSFARRRVEHLELTSRQPRYSVNYHLVFPFYLDGKCVSRVLCDRRSGCSRLLLLHRTDLYEEWKNSVWISFLITSKCFVLAPMLILRGKDSLTQTLTCESMSFVAVHMWISNIVVILIEFWHHPLSPVPRISGADPSLHHTADQLEGREMKTVSFNRIAAQGGIDLQRLANLGERGLCSRVARIETENRQRQEKVESRGVDVLKEKKPSDWRDVRSRLKQRCSGLCWYKGTVMRGFRAEQRFTVSLRCQISIGSRYTNNRSAASSHFQPRPVPSICTSGHAMSELLGKKTTKLQLSFGLKNKTTLIFAVHLITSRLCYLSHSFFLTSEFQANFRMIAASSELSCLHAVLQCNYWLPSAAAAQVVWPDAFCLITLSVVVMSLALVASCSLDVGWSAHINCLDCLVRR